MISLRRVAPNITEDVVFSAPPGKSQENKEVESIRLPTTLFKSQGKLCTSYFEGLWKFVSMKAGFSGYVVIHHVFLCVWEPSGNSWFVSFCISFGAHLFKFLVFRVCLFVPSFCFLAFLNDNLHESLCPAVSITLGVIKRSYRTFVDVPKPLIKY